MEKSQQYKLLTYAGTLPFIACALMSYANIAELPMIGSFASAAAAYSLVIVSFMAGTHWGSYLVTQFESPVNLFLSSNVIAVIVWLVFLFGSTPVLLLVSIAAFIALLLIDYRLNEAKIITHDYLHVRRNATAVVVISLFLTIGAL